MQRPEVRERVPAVLLAAVGGCVDAIGFIVLAGLFIAHQSGNSTGFGVALGQGDWATVLRRGFVIPVFVVATAAGVIALESASGMHDQDRRRRWLLLVEAALLVVFGVAAAIARRDGVLESTGSVYYLVGAVVATAMGLQNALLRKVGSQTVHTTFITGMLTDMAAGLAHLVLVHRHGSTDEQTRARALLSASVFAAYIVGAIVGSLGDHLVDLWTIVVPIGVVVALATMWPGAPAPRSTVAPP